MGLPNIWPAASKSIAKQQQKAADKKHKIRLASCKASIDTSSPTSRYYTHFAHNAKREYLQEQAYAEIDWVNRMLLQKMSAIMRSTTESTPNAKRSGAVSLNKGHRLKVAQDIQRQNQELLKSIQNAKATLNSAELDRHAADHQKHLANCCEYKTSPLTKKNKNSKKDKETAAVVQRRQEEALMAETQALLAAEEVTKSIPDTAEKLVLKQGSKIGEAYFLVEMKSDGRTLTITAYDSDTKKTYELIINEMNHRRLNQQFDSKYDEMIKHLKINENDRLHLPGAGEGKKGEEQ